jgi:hypothetical protein
VAQRGCATDRRQQREKKKMSRDAHDVLPALALRFQIAKVGLTPRIRTGALTLSHNRCMVNVD